MLDSYGQAGVSCLPVGTAPFFGQVVALEHCNGSLEHICAIAAAVI